MVLIRPSVIILGPAMHAVSGVSTHLRQLFNSGLSQNFRLMHIQVGSEGRNESAAGKLLRFLASPAQLIYTILSERPALIHLNTAINPKGFWRDVVYLLIARSLGIRTVYQVHGGALPEQFTASHYVFRAFMRSVLRVPDAVVVLALVEKLAYQQFVSLKRFLVIPNAIEVSEYLSCTKKDFSAETIRLAYIGRLAFDKGVRDALDAIGILQSKWGVTRVRFDIAGSGPDEGYLRRRVSELGIGNQVRFLGPLFKERKVRFWEAEHIFVFPTFHDEGLPYTILESLASGTPVVTTRVGGIPDAVQDGVHGLFVEPHEPAQLAEAIVHMEANRNMLKQMSLSCIKRARESYGIERLAHQFRNLYREIIEA